MKPAAAHVALIKKVREGVAMRAMHSAFLRFSLPQSRQVLLAVMATLAVPMGLSDAARGEEAGEGRDAGAPSLEQWLNHRGAPSAQSPGKGGSAPEENLLLVPILAATGFPGLAGHPTPLIIAVSPPGRVGTMPDPVTYVQISQLPENATISHGRDLGGGTWKVPLEELGDLTMTVPPDYVGTLTLSITAVSEYGDSLVTRRAEDVDVPMLSTRTAHPAQPRKELGSTAIVAQSTTSMPGESLALRSIPPAELPPAPAAKPVVAVPIPEATPKPPAPALVVLPEQKLLKRGDDLFTQGDLAGARLFYERAASGGSDQAALALGKTHDPLIHERLRVRGLSPDPDQAADWYRRAIANGNAEAEGRLRDLTAWLGARPK